MVSTLASEAAAMSDTELAARTAQSAGRLLMQIRADRLLTGAAAGDAGDLLANGLILAALRTWRPGDAILSEETDDDLARLGRARVWVVDPLDGTREYAEGTDDWSVHVALAVNGVPVAGAVALPARGRLFRSDCVNRPLEHKRALRMVVSRSRTPSEAAALARAVGAQLVPMGSAGAKAMAVVSGDADIYYHSGGQSEWDNCAPAAVALAAGLHVSRADGSPILYNCADVAVPDLIICRRALASRLIEAVKRL